MMLDCREAADRDRLQVAGSRQRRGGVPKTTERNGANVVAARLDRDRRAVRDLSFLRP